MNHRKLLWSVLFVLGGYSPLLTAQSQQWVVVDVAGQERVAFVPQREPYSTGGPAVSVPVPRGQALRLPSGEAVHSFEFIGWHEADAIRVVVWALVPREGGSSAAPRPAQDRFDRRQIVTMQLQSGEKLAVERLRELGMSRAELRVVER